MLKPFKVFYSLRPDFFHHNHIHRRKVDALRNAGIPASLVCFATEGDWRKYGSKYQDAEGKYDTQVISILDLTWKSKKARYIVRLFYIKQFLLYRRLLVHSLLSDPEPLYRLRQLPFFRKRLKLIMEYEGDLPAEWLYWTTVERDGVPVDEPPGDLADYYRWMLSLQSREVDNADALVVASQEHLDLVSERSGRALRGLAFPPMFDPKNARFSAEERARVRRELNFGDSIVLVHLGGALMRWHRFPELCRLVSILAQRGLDVRLLGLIRDTELDYARRHAEEAGIDQISVLLHSPSEQVAAYLSAGDIGLFLRHHHTMTRIVSSAKLGEYLACGLPVISTGAHAIFNEFMEHHDMWLKISDDLQIPAGFEDGLQSSRKRAQDDTWRARASNGVIEEFCVSRDPGASYVQFCRELLT